MTEKTQTASQEQLRELTSALVQGVPTDLSEETVLKCIQDKKKLHRWLRLGLTHGLTEIDFRLVKAFLEGTLELRFDQSARQRLEEDGWQIVRIPAGITLSSLANRIPVRIVKFPPSREYK
ncbi:MAG: hypothetical protein MUP45_01525 [Candidatus Marinimicrobia bacterium]|nr:hypothetical protein [Candidatus Neomarinimicrobiota bacterium]